MKVGEVLAVLEEASNGSAKAGTRCLRCRTVPEVPKGRCAEVPVPSASDKKATPTAKNVAKAQNVDLGAR